MKKHLSLFAAATALFLTVTPFAHANTPSKAKKRSVRQQAQVATVAYDTVTIRASQPQTGTEYGPELGSGAPHEERNPSAHPELFQFNR